MHTRERNDFATAAERYIDTAGLNQVIAVIADICRAKAAHVRENWQDDFTAAVWDGAARDLETAADGVSVRALSR